MNALYKVAVFLRRSCLSEKFTPTQKLILFTIAGIIGHRKKCWAKQSNIAKHCQLSERHFRREVQKLIDKKIIISEKKPTSKGLRIEYFLNDHEISKYNENDIDLSNEEQKATGHAWPDLSSSIGHIRPMADHPTGHICPEGQGQKTSESLVLLGVRGNEISLKYTLKKKIEDKKEKYKKEKVVKSKEEEKSAYDAICVPDWLKASGWENFEQHRQNSKKPMSAQAKKAIINRLSEYRSQGQDVHEIMENSIISNWSGVFPLKGRSHGTYQGNRNLTYTQAARIRGWKDLNDPTAWLPDDGLPQVVTRYHEAIGSDVF